MLLKSYDVRIIHVIALNFLKYIIIFYNKKGCLRIQFFKIYYEGYF